MKRILIALSLAFLLIAGIACSTNKNNTANTGDNAGTTTAAARDNNSKLDDDHLKDAFKQANLNDVKVHVDNDKRVVRLEGSVKTDADKARAEQIAKAQAGDYVVANEVGVRPEGDQGKMAKDIQGKDDDAIKAEWKSLEARMNMKNQHINADVKNGVLTLKGDVDTQSQRDKVEQAASKIPHVSQVVNELQVTNAGR